MIIDNLSHIDIIPEKSELRLLAESFSDSEFYIKNYNFIDQEIGLLELHGYDKKILELYNNKIIKNTNNGNSYVSYLIGITSVPPIGVLKVKVGSLPD